MSAEMSTLLAMPDVKEKLEAMGLTTLISSPEEFGAMIKSEIGLYLKVIKASNMKID
jgi:tripartite-type tricarboxylate transporter receptor subunit TctC